MERIYEFDKKQYFYKVEMINYLMIAILGYSVYRVIMQGRWWQLFALAGFVCIYALFNAFRGANPRRIKISDGEIAFSSFGKEKKWDISKLTKFRVKPSTAGYQALVRIADADKRQETYWITYYCFPEKKDLLAELDYLERKIHPDSIRFSGRGDLGKARPAAAAKEISREPHEQEE